MLPKQWLSFENSVLCPNSNTWIRMHVVMILVDNISDSIGVITET